jgi:hypothetical protein
MKYFFILTFINRNFIKNIYLMAQNAVNFSFIAVNLEI